MILQGLNSSAWCGPLIFQHLLFQYSIDITNHRCPEIHFRSGTRSYARAISVKKTNWDTWAMENMVDITLDTNSWIPWCKNTINLTYPTSKLEKNQFFLQSNFFSRFWYFMPFWQLAATRSRSQPLAVLAATHMHSQPLATTSSHSQPLAATRVAASGCKWPLQASGRKWPQVAAPSEWPQVAASGRPRQFPASGRKWPQMAAPSEWPQMAASGRSSQFQASGRKWPQVAASGRFLRFQFPPSKQPPCIFLLTRAVCFWPPSCLILVNPRAPFWPILVLHFGCFRFSWLSVSHF